MCAAGGRDERVEEMVALIRLIYQSFGSFCTNVPVLCFRTKCTLHFQHRVICTQKSHHALEHALAHRTTLRHQE